MEINGLKLPALFLTAIRDGLFRRKVGSWPLKRDVDAYGNPLETELAYVYGSKERIVRATAELSEHWKPDDCYGEPSEWANAPSFIPDILDFSKIVSFGMAADGAPFCLIFVSVWNIRASFGGRMLIGSASLLILKHSLSCLI